MALPLEELETATRKHFMPVITNQIFKISPVLYRIFKMAKEGRWGLALPSFDGKSIVEPLEYGEVADQAAQHGAYNKAQVWEAGSSDVLSGANYPWKMYFVSGPMWLRLTLKPHLIRRTLRLGTPGKALWNNYETG